jgi:hypothetical protein
MEQQLQGVQQQQLQVTAAAAAAAAAASTTFAGDSSSGNAALTTAALQQLQAQQQQQYEAFERYKVEAFGRETFASAAAAAAEFTREAAATAAAMQHLKEQQQREQEAEVHIKQQIQQYYHKMRVYALVRNRKAKYSLMWEQEGKELKELLIARRLQQQQQQPAVLISLWLKAKESAKISTDPAEVETSKAWVIYWREQIEAGIGLISG